MWIEPFPEMIVEGISFDRPVPWDRSRMTVCIAAACQVGTSYPVIVGCTDWRASSEVGKNDRYPKTRHLRSGWISLSAGTGSEITSLHRPLHAAMKAADTVDETNIVSILQSALRERKNQKANEYVGMKFGISYQDFVEKGRERFPPDVFRDSMAAISGLPILAEAIVCGFCDGVPLICKIDQAGRVSIRDHFAIIGEGEHLAAMALNHREHSDSDGLERTLYNVFEAKKCAESVTSVGESTGLFIMTNDGRKRINDATLSRLGDAFLTRIRQMALPLPAT